MATVAHDPRVKRACPLLYSQKVAEDKFDVSRLLDEFRLLLRKRNKSARAMQHKVKAVILGGKQRPSLPYCAILKK